MPRHVHLGPSISLIVAGLTGGGCFVEIGAGGTVPVAGQAEGVGWSMLIAAGARLDAEPVRVGVAAVASVAAAKTPGGGVLNVGAGHLLVEADVTVARAGDRLLRVSAAGQGLGGFASLFEDGERTPGTSSAYGGLVGATAQWLVRDDEGREEWAWSLRLAPDFVRAEHSALGTMTFVGAQLAARVEVGARAVGRGIERQFDDDDEND